MVDTRSNMKLADINSKPHGGKILRDLIERLIVYRFYPPTGLKIYKLFLLDQFHGPSHINDNHMKKNDTTLARIDYTNILCSKMYHKHPCQSNAKVPHFLQIFYLYEYE